MGATLEADMGVVGGHLPEIIIVLVVILIIWGPGKLPDVGAALGKGIREFRNASSDTPDAVLGATTTAPAPVVLAPTSGQPAEPVPPPAEATSHQPAVQTDASLSRALTGGTNVQPVAGDDERRITIVQHLESCDSLEDSLLQAPRAGVEHPILLPRRQS